MQRRRPPSPRTCLSSSRRRPRSVGDAPPQLPLQEGSPSGKALRGPRSARPTFARRSGPHSRIRSGSERCTPRRSPVARGTGRCCRWWHTGRARHKRRKPRTRARTSHRTRRPRTRGRRSRERRRRTGRRPGGRRSPERQSPDRPPARGLRLQERPASRTGRRRRGGPRSLAGSCRCPGLGRRPRSHSARRHRTLRALRRRSLSSCHSRPARGRFPPR